MTTRVIPPGATLSRPEAVAKRFDRKKSWLWSRVKTDPAFPKPIYLGPRQPVFIDAEVDNYLQNLQQAA